MLQCETTAWVSQKSLVPEGCRIVSLQKKSKKKRGFEQDDDRRSFVKDTVNPALSVTFVMLRDEVC